MGTYLSLQLKDTTSKGIAKANALWTFENLGYGDTLEFTTEQDILTDIEYIKLDEKQAHLRTYNTVEKWEGALYSSKRGLFITKITLGDYLCSEMARRYLKFIKRHSDLFIKLPYKYVMSILKEKAKINEKATECNCKFCRS